MDNPDTPTKTKLKRGSEVSKKDRPKHRSQKFRNEWTKSKDFEHWIAPVPQDEYKAFCKFCKVPMVAEMSVLKAHNIGKKHSQLLNGIKTKRLKTKIRNRLNTDTINGALHTKQHLSDNGNCITFKPTKNMINSMTKNILYKNIINENYETIW